MTFETLKQYVESHFFLPFDTWLGVIGLVLSVLFYRWQLNHALPTANISGTTWLNLGKTTREGLKVEFHGVPISRLSSTTLTFWNAGKIALRADDYSEFDPLRLTVAEGIDLFQVVVEKTDPKELVLPIETIRIGKDDTDRSIPLAFDFLKPGEGFKLRFTHSGNPFTAIKLNGRFSGQHGLEVWGVRPWSGLFNHPTLAGRLSVGGFMLFAGVVGGYFTYLSFAEGLGWYSFACLFVIYLFIAPGVIFGRRGPNDLGFVGPSAPDIS